MAISRVAAIGSLGDLAVLAGLTHLMTPLVLLAAATACMLGLAVYSSRATPRPARM